MVTLAFDTATSQATSALVDGDELLGERVTLARSLLVDVDDLLREAGLTPRSIERIVVGTGPGSFTGTRIGIAVARGLALGLGVPVAGVSTLDALAASGAVAVIDARRGQVFVAGPRAVAPTDLGLAFGTTCVGDGALRYRETLVEAGLVVPPEGDRRHLPTAVNHVRLAATFGPADEILPIYVREPDAVEAAR